MPFGGWPRAIPRFLFNEDFELKISGLLQSLGNFIFGAPGTLVPAFATAVPLPRLPTTEFVTNPVGQTFSLQASSGRIHPFGPPPSHIGKSAPKTEDETSSPRRRIVSKRPPGEGADKAKPVAAKKQDPPQKPRRMRRGVPTFSTLHGIASFLSRYSNNLVRMQDVKAAAIKYLQQSPHSEYDPDRHSLKFRNFFEQDGIISGRIDVYLGNPKSSKVAPIFGRRVYVFSFLDYRKRYVDPPDVKVFSRPEFKSSKPKDRFLAKAS